MSLSPRERLAQTRERIARQVGLVPLLDPTLGYLLKREAIFRGVVTREEGQVCETDPALDDLIARREAARAERLVSGRAS